MPSKVVLVGRPNVGKSTLFNRISGSRRAIVTDVPGTTRDVIASPAEWLGWSFELVDTGGMFGASADPLQERVVQHGWRAIAAGDLIVFIVDGQTGVLPADESIAQELRHLNVPVLVAMNKSDDKRSRDHLIDAYGLGFERVFEVSAEHGVGVDDLLDEAKRTLTGSRVTVARDDSEQQATEDRELGTEDHPPELVVAVIGRPNVGKSSLVNQLLKEERALVSEVPGTTRDAVDAVMEWRQHRFRIFDTAGMRRPGRVGRGNKVEALSVLSARRSLEQADVAVVLIDALEGATDQDAAIAGEADRGGCAVILAVNKWDLVKGRGESFVKTFDEGVRRKLKFLDYAPLLHLSARTGERLPRLLETIDRVAAARVKRVSTGELNRFVREIAKSHPPPASGRKAVRILYAVQPSIAPPTFLFFTNVATRFHFSYERFLVNRLREAFALTGTPIRIHTKARR